MPALNSTEKRILFASVATPVVMIGTIVGLGFMFSMVMSQKQPGYLGVAAVIGMLEFTFGILLFPLMKMINLAWRRQHFGFQKVGLANTAIGHVWNLLYHHWYGELNHGVQFAIRFAVFGFVPAMIALAALKVFRPDLLEFSPAVVYLFGIVCFIAEEVVVRIREGTKGF